MAEENTTDLTSTTENPAVIEVVPPPATGSEPSSTTDPTPEGEQSTLLTADPDAAPKTEVVEKTPEAIAAEAEHAKLFGAPEGDYEISGLPEGTVIDTEALAAFTPIAKELGLSNEGAAKIVGVYAEQILPKVAEQVVDGLQRDIAAQHAAWAGETLELVKDDAVFEGKPLADIQKIAAKALDRFGTPELREFLNTTGLGNYPGLMKFAYMAGSAISEDTTFERGGTAAKPRSTVEKFYGPQS